MSSRLEIKIDGNRISVPEGTYVIEACRLAGKEIPALCDYEGLEHFTSCMVCQVKDALTGNLLPSCSVRVRPGMDIITLDDEVNTFRKAALDLLLSDHRGDCEAPCQVACPAHMDIPRMNRFLAEGKFDEALRVVEKDICLPSVLGRICQAPCESACHRRSIDEPVAVCILKRYAGDFGKGTELKPLTDGPISVKEDGHNYPTDLTGSDLIGSDQPGKGGGAPATKKVAVIGAGPAGLSASYYLGRKGYRVTLFERGAVAGGLLHEARKDDPLYQEALEREVRQILDSGIDFRPGSEIDEKAFLDIRKEYDAVVLATGEREKEWGLRQGKSGVEADRRTYRSSDERVFAIGNAIRPVRSAVRAVGHGKEVASSVDQYLRGEKVTGHPGMFNSRFGRLLAEEFPEYLGESTADARVAPAAGEQEGFSPEEVMKEASRCMHCDCREMDNCKLRIYSDQYQADQKRFAREPVVPMVKNDIHENVIYEPGKCIKCGICVRLTEKSREKYGMTYIGRGFEVRIGIPFNEKMGKELGKLAEEVAAACPTGALAIKQHK